MQQDCADFKKAKMWFGGLSLVIVAATILLQKLEIIPAETWGWVWPVLLIAWGIGFILRVGWKE